jgi:hypothetical protein
MDETGEAVNWSALAQAAFKEAILNLAVRKETATMDDVIKRLRASKQAYDGVEAEAGFAAGERWAKEDAEYGELKRVADAARDPRLVISAASLVQLIDPHNNMGSHDWASFWESAEAGDRPTDEWLSGFAEGAASIYWQVKDQL